MPPGTGSFWTKGQVLSKIDSHHTVTRRHNPMTLEELKDCAGFTVQVTIDGLNALAQIESRYSADGLPHLACPAPLDESWGDVILLPISEKVAAKMFLNGGNNLFSTICLTTHGDGTVQYAE